MPASRFLREVARAWLMPWRAAARIREQEAEIRRRERLEGKLCDYLLDALKPQHRQHGPGRHLQLIRSPNASA